MNRVNLVNKLEGYEPQVGDRVYVRESSNDMTWEFRHQALTGTIFALDASKGRDKYAYPVGVLVDEQNTRGRTFSLLVERLGNDWGGFKEFVIDKGHIGKPYRWWPKEAIELVSSERSLDEMLYKLQEDVKRKD